MRVFSSEKTFMVSEPGAVFSLFLLLIMRSYRSTMTNTQRNHAVPYGSFEPIPTNPTPIVSTTSIPPDFFLLIKNNI